MTLLSIQNLRVTLRVGDADRLVLRGVGLELDEGEALAIVGESGSGKSMTARAVARLLPPRATATGRVDVNGVNVLELEGRQLRAYQSSQLGMVFQDPRSHLNPVRTIGDFLTEGLVATRRMSRRAANHRALELLEEVGIPDADRRLRQYPHQLSGGQLQRVMIASAISCEPRLLLADEPTTALDVSTQSDVLALLDELRRERGMAMVFISHDIELAAAICDRMAVMYAGEIVEIQKSDRLVQVPLHPYTAGLLGARPDIGRAAHRLSAIPGHPLAAFEAPLGCAFYDRCGHHQDPCTASHPAMETRGGGSVRCLRAGLDLTHTADTVSGTSGA
jgi:oligopeptide/dipeptide ABC transporter ATP-binding protein